MMQLYLIDIVTDNTNCCTLYVELRTNMKYNFTI